jgi:HK97 gp10 family phage protein
MAVWRSAGGATQVRVEGLAELESALSALRLPVQRTVLREVARKALEPMRQTAVDKAPDDPATHAPDLKSSIEISPRRSTRSGGEIQLAQGRKSSVQMYMGPTKDGYPEAMVQEFGARAHDIGPRKQKLLELRIGGQFISAHSVHHPGNRPQPYMRPAFEQHKESAIQIVAHELGGLITKAAEREARRAARIVAKWRRAA